jgi:putative ABC transport system permease protein
MRYFYKFPLRLRSLFRKERLEQELTDELHFHLEKLIDENVKKKGMTPKEARHAALRELGGLQQIKEECRDMRRVNYIENFFHDLRYGLRMLAKNPGFATVAVLTLALGIGANSAVFSVVYAVLLRPFPYKDSGSLVIVWEQNPSRDWTTNIVSPANFNDWRRQNSVFAGMAAVDPTSFNLTDSDQPIEIGGERVTANLLSLLGIQPIRGRGFQPEDDKAGSAPVALVSYGLWQRRYGGDAGLIGRMIILDGRSYPVVGIMPPEFSDPYTTFF